MADSSWMPTATPEMLNLRSELVWRIRSWMHDNGFSEVHTPTISRDTVVDRYIDPISLSGKQLGIAELSNRELFLQTSPEFCMKRLIASGMQAIYQICPAYRSAESGKLHNPEFTMLEWYRVGDDMQAGVDLLSEVAQVALQSRPALQRTYQAAFVELAGCDPLEDTTSQLASVASEKISGIDRSFATDRDDWLNLILDRLVQPKLGIQQPCVLTHYPASQSALARITPDDSRTAERFELFVAGIELGNGYHELLDASVLEARNKIVGAQRQQDQSRDLPSRSYLLDAMRAGLPACSGCAIGLDRLGMVATGSSDIRDVIAFPIDRA